MKRPFPFRALPRLAAVLLACGLLTACGQSVDSKVAPTEIGKDTYCALDGMLLGDYPGPKAQIHFAGQPEPEFFCDTMEMFSIYLKPEQARKVAAIYVQDLDKTTWEEPKGAWIDAKTAFYVVGSKKRAATLEKTRNADKPWKFGILARTAKPGIFELAHSMGNVTGVLPNTLKS